MMVLAAEDATRAPSMALVLAQENLSQAASTVTVLAALDTR